MLLLLYTHVYTFTYKMPRYVYEYCSIYVHITMALGYSAVTGYVQGCMKTT